MISQLVEAKPEELRVYLEEAAGISKYKERRRETENRIKHTRENLERINDIREELGRQLDRLQRQAQAAARYRDCVGEETLLTAQLYALRHAGAQNTLVERNANQPLELEQRKGARGTATARSGHRREAGAARQTTERFNEVQGSTISWAPISRVSKKPSSSIRRGSSSSSSICRRRAARRETHAATGDGRRADPHR